MKATIAAVTALLALTVFPAVLTGGDSPPLACGIASGPIEPILATIRTLESGGNYQAQAARSSASGAYQFLDSTWNGYGGYTHAADAPPAVQDAKAAEHVTSILDTHGNDVSAVPVVWYIGHLPGPSSPEWDIVPAPGAGNRLTPRQYQQRWLDTYQHLSSATEPSTSATAGSPPPGSAPPASTCVAGSVTPIDGEWSLPGPIDLIDANPQALTRPHHDYPAWDWPTPIDTPIYAMRSGTVTAIRTWPHNWFEQGCGPNDARCDTCGIGLTITDTAGTRWTYCHGTRLAVALGATITAGQQILWSGNTGRSSGPHLHLEIRTRDGQRRCPQPLLKGLHQHHEGVDATSLPALGCSY